MHNSNAKQSIKIFNVLFPQGEKAMRSVYIVQENAHSSTAKRLLRIVLQFELVWMLHEGGNDTKRKSSM